MPDEINKAELLNTVTHSLYYLMDLHRAAEQSIAANYQDTDLTPDDVERVINHLEQIAYKLTILAIYIRSDAKDLKDQHKNSLTKP